MDVLADFMVLQKSEEKVQSEARENALRNGLDGKREGCLD